MPSRWVPPCTLSALLVFTLTACCDRGHHPAPPGVAAENGRTADMLDPPRNIEKEPLPSGVVVYVTNTGRDYHTTRCGHLAKSKIAMPLEDATRKGYLPCPDCGPPR